MKIMQSNEQQKLEIAEAHSALKEFFDKTTLSNSAIFNAMLGTCLELLVNETHGDVEEVKKFIGRILDMSTIKKE